MNIIKAFRNEDGDKAFDLILEENFSGSEVDKRNGYTILHHAVEFGDPEIVSALFELDDQSKVVDIQVKDKEEATPLVLALECGFPEIVSILLQNGADASDVYKGESMLMLAAGVKNEKITNSLLNKGADPNYHVHFGTALHFAIQVDNAPMITALLNHTPYLDLRKINHNRETPFHLAVRLNHTFTVSKCLEMFKKTVKEDDDDEEEEIITLGYDPKEVLLAVSKEGLMPIHEAAQNGKSTIIQAIRKCALKLGVTEEQLVDEEGRTVEDILEENKEIEQKMREIKQREEEEARDRRVKSKQLKDLEEKKKRETQDKLKKLEELREFELQQAAKNEEKKRPIKLLIFFAGFLILLFLLLKVAVNNKAGGGRNDEVYDPRDN